MHSSAYHDAHFSLNKIPFVSGYICVSGLWIVGGQWGERESLRVCMCKNIQIKVRKMSENYLLRLNDFKVFTTLLFTRHGYIIYLY